MVLRPGPHRGFTRLTHEQYIALAGPLNWTVHDVPRSEWANLPKWMGTNSDTLAVMASGDLSAEITMKGLEAVGGVDWLRHESRPKRDEKPGNAYHFVIVKKTADEYLMHGPFTKHGDTIVPHHFDPEDLEAYWS